MSGQMHATTFVREALLQVSFRMEVSGERYCQVDFGEYHCRIPLSVLQMTPDALAQVALAAYKELIAEIQKPVVEEPL